MCYWIKNPKNTRTGIANPSGGMQALYIKRVISGGQGNCEWFNDFQKQAFQNHKVFEDKPKIKQNS